MALAALLATRLHRPPSRRVKVAEMTAIFVLFVSAWLSAHELAGIDAARAGAAVALSYGLTRLAVDCEGTRHLLPSVALAAGVLAGGRQLLSLGICLLPLGGGLVILGSPRATVVTTFVALGPAAIAVVASRF